MIGGYGCRAGDSRAGSGYFQKCASVISSKPGTIAEIWQEDGTKLLVQTQITGILRGLLRDGYLVTEHFKVADVDPRKEELSNCFLISDKARCIAGSVLSWCVPSYGSKETIAIVPLRKILRNFILIIDV